MLAETTLPFLTTASTTVGLKIRGNGSVATDTGAVKLIGGVRPSVSTDVAAFNAASTFGPVMSSTVLAICSKTYVASQLLTAESLLLSDLSNAFMSLLNCRMPGTLLALAGG